LPFVFFVFKRTTLPQADEVVHSRAFANVRAGLHGEQFRETERPASSLAWLIAIAKIKKSPNEKFARAIGQETNH